MPGDRELTGRVPTDPQATELRLAALEAEQARQGSMLKEIHAAIVGPPDASRPGHAEQLREHGRRLDALEEGDKQRLKWQHLAGASILGGAITHGMNWLFGGHLTK